MIWYFNTCIGYTIIKPSQLTYLESHALIISLWLEYSKFFPLAILKQSMQYGNHVYLAVQENIGIYGSYLTLTHQPLPLSSFALPPLPADGLVPSTFKKPCLHFTLDHPHHIFTPSDAPAASMSVPILPSVFVGIRPIHVMSRPQCVQGKWTAFTSWETL